MGKIGMLSKLKTTKDNLTASALKKYINGKMAGIGEVLKIEFNSVEKSITAKVTLNGEDTPLDIYLEQYRVFHNNDSWFIRLHGVRTSKDWLTYLYHTLLGAQDLRIPDKLVPILKVLT